MPVKIKGIFNTGVPNANAVDNAVLFNWVSWSDPRSSNPTQPDIYSVGCEVTYKENDINLVKVTNYKGKKSFLGTELDWNNLKKDDINKDIRTSSRTNTIDYYYEFS